MLDDIRSAGAEAWKKLNKVLEKFFRLTGSKQRQALQDHPEQQRKQIVFVHGKGTHKSEEQRYWEELAALCKQWEKYENSLRIMGESRNSYAKTDLDATFMRMKDDHMRNGQLKPAYNVQIAVNSEYITGVDVFSNRTDFGTLVPFLNQLRQHHETQYKEVTADTGYKSLENYLFLEESGLSHREILRRSKTILDSVVFLPEVNRTSGQNGSSWPWP